MPDLQSIFGRQSRLAVSQSAGNEIMFRSPPILQLMNLIIFTSLNIYYELCLLKIKLNKKSFGSEAAEARNLK